MRVGKSKAMSLVVGMVASAVMAGLIVVAPAASASVGVPSAVPADASDRAALRAGLQRSWAKLDSAGRYKTCWMWTNRPDLVRAGLASSFRGYGVSTADVYSVARNSFNVAC